MPAKIILPTSLFSIYTLHQNSSLTGIPGLGGKGGSEGRCEGGFREGKPGGDVGSGGALCNGGRARPEKLGGAESGSVGGAFGG